MASPRGFLHDYCFDRAAAVAGERHQPRALSRKAWPDPWQAGTGQPPHPSAASRPPKKPVWRRPNLVCLGTMLGITYVIDMKALVFDEKALLAVNDLGPLGETWSLNAISYSQGRLYHRSSKELVCIGTQ